MRPYRLGQSEESINCLVRLLSNLSVKKGKEVSFGKGGIVLPHGLL
jgi:hypothetical protein